MKKILLSLFVWFVWFISFCSADFFPWNSSTRVSLWAWNSWTSSCDWYCCFIVSSSNSSARKLFTITYNWNTYNLFDSSSSYNYDLWCFAISWSFTIYNWSEQFPYLYPYYMWTALPSCNPQYTSEECQSVYGLVSSWSLNQCNNDLLSCETSLSWYESSLSNCSTNLNVCNTSLSNCLQSNCSNNSWVSWSSLFINDIQHLGAWIIDITIPEEISWDYNNDTENDTFDLIVSWYNVDTAYIEWVINTQKTLPNEQDFNNIITWLIPLLIPWFVIILFLYFVFRFIKKIF